LLSSSRVEFSTPGWVATASFVARRSAFLIDADGTVRGAWAYDDSEVPDVDELVSAAQALSPSP
jgi:peroxiredoxin